MEEMSESREVYESKPGKAGIILLYVIVALFAIAILWMVVSKMDIVDDLSES